MKSVIYARVHRRTHEACTRVAEVLGVSISTVVDALVSDATGRHHPLAPIIRDTAVNLCGTPTQAHPDQLELPL